MTRPPDSAEPRETRVTVCDIGGTHARFAVASVAGGSAIELGEPVTLPTAAFPSFGAALEQYSRQAAIDRPSNLAIAFAGPVGGEQMKLTNGSWVIRPGVLRGALGIERLTIVNDFGAVAHSVAVLPPRDFTYLCGPDEPLPAEGVISVIGPGTGLGSAILRRGEGHYQVIETEAGHIDFAPLEPVEDRILRELRDRFSRVSVERLASGRGLANIHRALAAIDGSAATVEDEKQLWSAALEGSDPLVAGALDRLCRILGSVAGDIALAQGAQAVVIAGGLGRRLSAILPRSGFGERFVAKGRYQARMKAMPVRLVTHAEPGLYGAAAAFAREHCC